MRRWVLPAVLVVGGFGLAVGLRALPPWTANVSAVQLGSSLVGLVGMFVLAWRMGGSTRAEGAPGMALLAGMGVVVWCWAATVVWAFSGDSFFL